VQHSENTSNPEGIARRSPLPNDEFDPAWTSIKLAAGVHDRLLAQSLLSFTVRQKLAFEVAPLHGLILLTGAPGTGKTTLGRGLANQVSKQLSGAKCTYVEINPHALTSSALGRSQQAVAKLFEKTIPEIAMHGAVIALLDEVETLAVSRHQLSLEANPIDVHRATDAALAGMDRLTREHRNVLLIATTNFPKALDSAMLSRADHIEEIGLPTEAARREIILDTLKAIATVWKKVHALEADAGHFAKAAEGLDGRRIRKEIFVAIGSDIETAKDPNKVTKAQIEAAFRRALKIQGAMTK
jgi:SpoVK/Ycf46/Vps4 family AAA+-type ATPase